VPELRFDRFYGYDDLTALLHGWAEERPDVFRLESIGRSYEDRDIWLCTVTRFETGPPLDKPGFIVEANIHSVEWTGSAAALHLLRRLVDAGDDRVEHLLDTRVFYVIPRLNPDGSEHALKERRFIRSSVRPYPLLEAEDGLHAQDMDGDGRVLSMRVRDPNGPWKPHPDDPRVLVGREPDELEGESYRLFPEGEIENWDGVTIKRARPVEGLDLNRNFPASWGTESEQLGAGPYPVSEPETRAYVQAVVERPNIVGHVAYHTYSGVHLRPYAGRPDDDFPVEDLQAFKLIGEQGTKLTGYPAVSIFHGFKYHPKQTLHGDVHDWMYDHLGAFSWTTEFWSPPREAGIELEHPIEWMKEHPIDDDLALLRWSDEHCDGKAHVDWYPFDHPQLGPVELGGWDVVHYWFNIPFERLEQEVAPHTEWALWQAAVTPLLAVRSLEAEQVAPGVHRVRLVLENRGWLPTNGTKKALERKAVRPLEIELELPEGARLAAGEEKTEAGQLTGRAEHRSTIGWFHDPSTTDLAKLEWVVEAPAGGTLGIVATHQRAGTVREELQLG
jgi:murein tripeptide amidase MpaA